MINVLMSGCNGKMGQVISKLSQDYTNLKISAGYDVYDGIKNYYPVYTKLSDIKEDIDVIIDFSNPAALEGLIKYAGSNNTPLILATTGFSSEQIELIYNTSKEIPIFYSANMSLGINLLIDLVKKAAKVLEGAFDIEIIEKHHNQKLDAPSGTALAIADSINSVLNEKQMYVYDRHTTRAKRTRNEMGIHAIRGGTIAGEHTVIFAGNDEILEIKHTAISKEILATGALKAAQYMYKKPAGLYQMDDMIK